MSVVGLEIISAPTASEYSNQFVVELQFSHDDDALTTKEEVVFPADQKADVIAFINAAKLANDFVEDHCREPEEGEDDEDVVAAFEQWFNYSNPGLQAWPTDSNGDYYGRLEYVTVAYYDRSGTRFEVNQVEG